MNNGKEKKKCNGDEESGKCVNSKDDGEKWETETLPDESVREENERESRMK